VTAPARGTARARRAGWITLGAALIIYPLLVPRFWVFQIGAQSLWLGIIALSLIFLAGYGGMVSLAQMTLAGVAGYTLALLGGNSLSRGVELPWPIAVIAALAAGGTVGLLFGLIAVRTQGIYLLMITLAMSMSFYYLALQNVQVFNAYDGFSGVRAPVIAGVSLRQPTAFYYLCLGTAALLYGAVWYLVRTPFGLALQGVRDNPRRMRALGYWVGLHRVAAFGVAGLIAATGGVLAAWYHARISPGSVDLGETTEVLVTAVIGGFAHPIGAFIGALVFTLVQNFAVDFIHRERFNTLIGLTFLAIVLFSPDGVLGLGQRLSRLADRWLRGRRARARPAGRPTLTPDRAPSTTVTTGHRVEDVNPQRGGH
jgi:branched-chain amino acid transport system permease protein